MRKIFIGLAAATALGISAPAAAQFYGYAPQGYGYAPQGYGYAPQGYGQQSFGGLSQQFYGRIQAGIQQGRIDRQEAAYLFGKVNQLAHQEQRLAYRGYGDGADRTLRIRARALQRAIAKAERSPAWARRGW